MGNGERIILFLNKKDVRMLISCLQDGKDYAERELEIDGDIEYYNKKVQYLDKLLEYLRYFLKEEKK